jgi:hypothetical protein
MEWFVNALKAELCFCTRKNKVLRKKRCELVEAAPKEEIGGRESQAVNVDVQVVEEPTQTRQS